MTTADYPSTETARAWVVRAGSLGEAEESNLAL